MPRPWFEAGITQAVQQVINAVKGVLGPELFLEDALKVFAAKRADAIAAAGSSLDAGLEYGLVIASEVSWRARSRLLGKVSQPSVAIAVGPLLYKPPTAPEVGCDLGRCLPVQREQDRPIPITLFGVAFLSLKLLEEIQILDATKFNVHAKPPCICRKEV